MSDIVTDPARLRVLPCARSRSFLTSQDTAGRWLTPALPADLPSRVAQDRPDVILLYSDTLHPDVWRRLAPVFADTPTLLLSPRPTSALRMEAARLNISSVLSSAVDEAQLSAALLAVHAGLKVSELNGRDSASVPFDPPLEELTSRERQVLERMAAGQHNREIADALNVSEHTVKFHVSSILGKLGARTRTEAVRSGIAQGLVTI